MTNKIGRPRSESPICSLTEQTRNSESFLLAVKKKPFECALTMARTVLLHCPISAEIRTVDSQSDLRICYSYDYKQSELDNRDTAIFIMPKALPLRK